MPAPLPVRVVPSVTGPDARPGDVEVRIWEGVVWGLAARCPGCGGEFFIVLDPEERPEHTWQILAGDPRDPPTLTLAPSLLNRCCGWHGYLVQGVFQDHP